MTGAARWRPAAVDVSGTVYLLHFARPYRHARHYCGWTTDLAARLDAHAAGRGARLLAVIQAAGISWTLARTWPGGKARERALKSQGGAARRCPLCGIRPRREPAPAPPAVPAVQLPPGFAARPRPGDPGMLAEVAAVFLDGEAVLPLAEITRRLPACPNGPRFGWEISVMAAILRRNGLLTRHYRDHPDAVLLADLRAVLAREVPGSVAGESWTGRTPRS